VSPNACPEDKNVVERSAGSGRIRGLGQGNPAGPTVKPGRGTHLHDALLSETRREWRPGLDDERCPGLGWGDPRRAPPGVWMVASEMGRREGGGELMCASGGGGSARGRTRGQLGPPPLMADARRSGYVQRSPSPWCGTAPLLPHPPHRLTLAPQRDQQGHLPYRIVTVAPPSLFCPRTERRPVPRRLEATPSPNRHWTTSCRVYVSRSRTAVSLSPPRRRALGAMPPARSRTLRPPGHPGAHLCPTFAFFG
jgi:hypothetical protein